MLKLYSHTRISSSVHQGPRSKETSVAMSPPRARIFGSFPPHELGLLKEMADSRTKAGKLHALKILE